MNLKHAVNLSVLFSLGNFIIYSAELSKNRSQSQRKTDLEILFESASEEEDNFYPSSDDLSADDDSGAISQENGHDFPERGFVLARNKNTTQFRVLDQTSSNFGAADRSCGYHALKNGIIISDMLLKRDAFVNCLQRMQDPESIYLNTRNIKIFRLKAKAIELLRRALLVQLNKTERETSDPKQLWRWNNKETFLARDRLQRDLFINCLTPVAKKLMSSVQLFGTFLLALKGPQSLIIPLSDIVRAIRNEISEQIKNKSTNLSTLELMDDEKVVNKYFAELSVLDIAISDDELEERTSKEKLNIKSSINVDFEQYKAGNWLDREEIQFLLGEYEENINPEVSWIVLGDAGNNLTIREQLELESGIKAELLNDDTRLKVLIIFDTNHWITCVIDGREEHKNYYVTNSFNNQIIIDSDIIRQVKNIVEGKPILPHEISSANSKDQQTDIKIGQKTEVTFEKSTQRFSNIFTVVNQNALNVVREWKSLKELTKRGIFAQHSMLLHGEPGTGKTLLAQAIAGEMDAYFYQIMSAQILKKYYGESTEFIINLFDDAVIIAQNSGKPVVIFLDEIDAVASESTESARTDVLHSLHAIFDRPKYKNRILLIAATNKIDKLAETFISRMGILIYMKFPDDSTRKSLIESFSKRFDIPLSETNITSFVQRMDTLSQREIEIIFRQAVALSVLDKFERAYAFHVDRALDDKIKEKKDAHELVKKRQEKAGQTQSNFKRDAATGAAGTIVVGALVYGAKKYYERNKESIKRNVKEYSPVLQKAGEEAGKEVGKAALHMVGQIILERMFPGNKFKNF